MVETVSLFALQDVFSRMVPQLLDKAHELGFMVTLGETWRSTATARVYHEQGKGIPNSLHCDRLAIDINLFKNDEYVRDSESYGQLGAFWESLHPLARWGGHFEHPDGNHFSLEYEGRR